MWSIDDMSDPEPSAVVVVWRSADAATSRSTEAPTSASSVLARIVTYAAPTVVPAGVARAHASLTSTRGSAGESSLAAQKSRAQAEEKSRVESAFRGEPFVQDVLSRFDAKIRPDSIKPLG